MKATEVIAGLAESNGSLLPGLWHDSLHVTCGLTACTLGSTPGPTLGNEYRKTLPYLFTTPYKCMDSKKTGTWVTTFRLNETETSTASKPPHQTQTQAPRPTLTLPGRTSLTILLPPISTSLQQRPAPTESGLQSTDIQLHITYTHTHKGRSVAERLVCWAQIPGFKLQSRRCLQQS